MAVILTSDISRMIVAGQKEIFFKNFDPYPVEYPAFSSMKTSNKERETYDSVGNLQGASIKPEGDAISYGKVEQAYQTTIVNQTHANGIAHSLEAKHFDLYGVVNSAKASELARTMREEEEEYAIKAWDNAFTTNLADGAPLCTNSRPLFNVPGTFNDTLATSSALSNPDNHKTMQQMFTQFKNHQGGPMKCKPTDALTHSYNMLTIEEIYMSANKAGEISNTKNVLMKPSWHYSTYLTSTTAWFMFDKYYDHAIFQWNLKTQLNSDTDLIHTMNMYFNALAIYGVGAVPNVGIVGNAGA